MVDERTVGCVIVALGDFYKSLGECAKNSFKKFHPEVELFYIDDESIKNYGYLQSYLPGQLSENKGITKFRIARDIMREEKLAKLIVLGADTITCSRLDEFMDRNRSDILGTCDYLYPRTGERGRGDTRWERTLNADVVCFNSLAALSLVVKIAPLHLSHFEQGALNEVFFDNSNGVTGALIEETHSDMARDGHSHPDVRTMGDHFLFPQPNEWNSQNVCYNVLSKSTLYLDREDEYGNRHLDVSIVIPMSSHKPWKPFVSIFSVDNGKLFTGDGRQIKVWHYCESFGSLVDTESAELINKWIFEWFNEDTKTFFKDYCGCGDFFEKDYVF